MLKETDAYESKYEKDKHKLPAGVGQLHVQMLEPEREK